MKNKYLKLPALALAGLMLFSAFGCADTGKEEGTDPAEGTEAVTEAQAELIDFFSEDKPYVALRPDLANQTVTDLFVAFRKAVNDKTGAKLELNTDWVRDESQIQPNEILFGATNRPESAEALARLTQNGFIICVINGKLVIHASNDKLLANAVTYFSEDILGKGKTVFESDFLYVGEAFAPIRDVTINGIPLKEYTLTVPSKNGYNQPLYTAQTYFSKYCGVTVAAAEEKSAPAGHKIVIGPAGKTYGQFETEIYYKDGNLYLGCAGEGSAEQVIYAFFDKYLDQTGTAALQLPEDGSAVYHTAEMDWDNANPALLSVQDRVVRSCYKLEQILQYDKTQGLWYTYQGSGYKGTIAAARESGNRTTNCVIVGNWVMKDAGFYSDGIYNHKYGKDGAPAPAGYSFGGGSAKFFNEHFEVIDLVGKNRSIQSLYQNGEVLPGDIIGFRNHNQTILPNGYAFDGGRNTSNMEKAETGGKFLRWVGPNPYPTMVVDYIFRSKDAE